MWNCRNAVRLLNASLDHQLSRRERSRLSFHLLLCHLCRRYKRQIRLLELALRENVGLGEEGLSPEAQRAILDKVAKL
ncbi:MAG: zf-HC2 domain-containing protein [Acidobacteriota bacterium]